MTDELTGLKRRLAVLYREALYNRLGVRERVRLVIEDARQLLGEAGGLGPWEGAELDRAAAALANKHCRLALIALSLAVEVSELAPEEYQWGLRQFAADPVSDAD